MKQDILMNPMDQQPDKFFREKLEQHQLTAPDTAWARIAGDLEIKRPYPWLRAAAVLVPLAVAAGYLLIHFSGSKDAKTIAVKSDRTEQQEVRPAPGVSNEEASSPVAVSTAQKTSRTVHARKPVTQQEQQPVIMPSNEIETPIVAQAVPNAELKNSPANEPGADNNNLAADGNKNNVVTIYMSMDESLKYLDKNYREEATSAQAKSSKLHKLVDFATDIKDPMGEIRQFKQDLLAFNFKNEKKDQTK